jgi:fumarate hydratase class II
MLVTALNLHVGYHQAARIALTTCRIGISLRERRRGRAGGQEE